MNSNGYLTSPEIQVSTANYELVPTKPEKWTHGYKIRKLSFDNIEECTIVINNEAVLRLKAGQGFEMRYNDPPIQSFIIKEAGVSFNFVMTY